MISASKMYFKGCFRETIGLWKIVKQDKWPPGGRILAACQKIEWNQSRQAQKRMAVFR
jgi:hypothetical protein